MTPSSASACVRASAAHSAIAYGYDEAGRLRSKDTSGVAGAGRNSYGYDDAGRLVSWDDGD
ncbi:hypothetical protein, partial [Haloechinothrix sp. LS1_15]|uniref:hypothetical protein n=1 Tax=Haloechinothrix sp. LS1_15 TaxID=2652248 RepID=UPI00294A9CD0